MNRRNWEYLARKLVDATDLDYTINAIQLYMAQNNLAFYGEGVLVTTTYAEPFPIFLSAADLTGSVGNGIAYDSTGYQVRIDDGPAPFTVTPGDASNPRADLLVLRFKTVGDTLIPEPALPTTSVYLNLHDGYELAVIPGTPGPTPAYPAKGQFDVVLAGIRVPAGATTGPDLSLDFGAREMALALKTFFPTFKQETPVGPVDGTNKSFVLSQTPFNAASLIVSVGASALRSDEWTLTGKTITLVDAPQVGQDVYAWYVVNSAGSVNPISGVQETPTGTVDGANPIFNLSQEPIDQNSMQVFIDGIVVPVNQWSLVQNPNVSQIRFNAGSIPQPGQEVYAFYLRNVLPSYSGGVQGGQAGGGSGGVSNLATDYPQLSTNDVGNGFVSLAHTPANPAAVLVDLIGGGAQVYGADFTINGNKLTWSNDLAANLAAGDRFRVHYAY